VGGGGGGGVWGGGGGCCLFFGCGGVGGWGGGGGFWVVFGGSVVVGWAALESSVLWSGEPGRNSYRIGLTAMRQEIAKALLSQFMNHLPEPD